MKKIGSSYHIVLFFAILFSCIVTFAQSIPPKVHRILFLGNSITYEMQIIRLTCEARNGYERKCMILTAVFKVRTTLMCILRCLAQWCSGIDNIIKWHMEREKGGTL